MSKDNKFCKKRPVLRGIPLLKKHGQFFLRDKSIVEAMLAAVDLKGSSVFEIGCGDGFLTKTILEHPVKRLEVFEIDPMWGEKIGAECKGPRFTMNITDFLKVEADHFTKNAPWIVLSNLPYHLTFPILHKITSFGDLVPAGVYMMQEEVAQKIMKKEGRGYGYVSLFFQYYFDWKLLCKVLPTSFFPQPKVFSRLISFVRKKNVPVIPDEVGFWKFIKFCFAYPRRTLRNNLAQTHLDLTIFEDALLAKRAQELTMQDFLGIWEVVRHIAKPPSSAGLKDEE